jgi:hypothetical protein
MCVFWQLLTVMMPAGGRSSGCAVAGVIAVEEAGECVDGFEQQGVDLGLLVSGVLGAVGRDETVPSGGCLLFVLGGLVPGLVAGPPPAQCFGAGDGLAAGVLVSLW